MVSALEKKWLRIVSEWQESGLTKAEYCRQESINLRKFSYHSIKHHAFSKPRKAEEMKSDSFAEVVCIEEASTAAARGAKIMDVPKQTLILRLDCGGSVELKKDFDADLLRRVLEVARNLS